MNVSVRIVAHAYAKFFSKYIAIMKKKIYNQPITDVTVLEADSIMQGIMNPVSSGGKSSENGGPIDAD